MEGMRKVALAICGALVLPIYLQAQEVSNTAGRMMQEESKLTLGGYGQVDYNQLLDNSTYNPGGLDVHRLVLMFGYKFNARTQFITEIELEHVKEVYVEQAFLQYEILPWLKLRGGLMLIPMGIINEYHEPSTFNGVERPNLDKYLVPTTWREIGAGFTGTFPAAAVSYQLYLVNGFKGYDNGPTLTGSNAFRSGRQKGAESIIHAPNLAFKLNYFGISGLQLGLSAYTGKTQSSLYGGLDRDDDLLVSAADSSVVGLSMMGLDARYTLGGLGLRGQANLGLISHSATYNEFTGSDLGSSIGGWYLELSYDLLHTVERFESGLIPFIRYEQYSTHLTVEAPVLLNPAYQRSDLTLGLGWRLASGAMFKTDIQWFGNKATGDSRMQFNAGVAVWF